MAAKEPQRQRYGLLRRMAWIPAAVCRCLLSGRRQFSGRPDSLDMSDGGPGRESGSGVVSASVLVNLPAGGLRQAQRQVGGVFAGTRGFVDFGRHRLERQAKARQQFVPIARRGPQNEGTLRCR